MAPIATPLKLTRRTRAGIEVAGTGDDDGAAAVVLEGPCPCR